VVKVGKGTARQALTQIGGLVRIGNAATDQTKIANAIRSVSEDLGRDW